MNHSTHFFKMKILFFFVGFWFKFGPRKLFFGLTWGETFFSIQFWNILKFTKTFFDNMCVLSYKKSINGFKSIFHEYVKKIIKHFAKKNVSMFKSAIFCIFEHTKKNFCLNVLLFFIVFMKNAFETIYCFFFYTTKRTCCQKMFL